jgi:hypothetical protein
MKPHKDILDILNRLPFFVRMLCFLISPWEFLSTVLAELRGWSMKSDNSDTSILQITRNWTPAFGTLGNRLCATLRAEVLVVFRIFLAS